MSVIALPERRILLPDTSHVIDDAKRRIMQSIGLVLGGSGQVGRVLGQASAAPAADWWEVAGQTCVVAYQPKGAADYAASLVNLANPGTYNATAGSAPSWASGTGWTFNGSSHYLICSWVPANNNITSLIYYNYTGTGDDQTLFGFYKSGAPTGAIQLAIRNHSPIGMISYNGAVYPTGTTVNSPVLTSGVYGFANKQPYRNGSPESTTINAASSSGFLTPYIGAADVDSSPAGYLPGSIYAIVFYSTVLSGAEVATVSAAMAAL